VTCPYCNGETTSLRICEKCGQDMEPAIRQREEALQAQGRREAATSRTSKIIGAIASIGVGVVVLILAATGQFKFRYGAVGWIGAVVLVGYGIIRAVSE
jgi:hypothetical protein